MENNKISDKKYREGTKKIKQEFYAKIGKSCFICKCSNRLVCHRKDYKPHMRLANLDRSQLKKEKVEDYVRLCFQCHYGAHWAHNFFKLSWEDIVNHLK